MNRRELVNAIAGHTGQITKEVDNTLRGFVDVILANVAKGESISLPGFAKFSRRSLPARMGRNPATGEQIKLKASVKGKITPLKGFKDVAAGKAKAPKLGAAPEAAKKAPAKKAPAKKAPAKKAPAKKAPAKKAAKKKK